MYRNMPIRTKLLVSMIVFTVIPILFVTMVALIITYNTMRDQLIYNHRMSSGWLQDRLTLETKEVMNYFYEFEVNKDVKSDILTWCTMPNTLEYESRWRLITTMNSIISMNSSINSIELFNLSNDTVLIAERSGANLESIDNRLDFWKARDESLQSNIVYFRDDYEILAVHEIRRFEDNVPVAVIALHMRPYALQRILEDIKTEQSESILLFNDQGCLILGDYAAEWAIEEEYVQELLALLAASESKETLASGQFWFYRPINAGKLQILLTVPNKTIVQALFPTLLSGLLVALLAVLASVVCSVLYSRAVSLPIQKLSAQIKSLTLDEFAGAFSENRQDEIGLLQTSFDHMIKRNRELIAQQYQSKLEKRNAQLRALQAQINPHFMYNTLQVIGGMALDKNAPEVYDITLALSDIMRYSLNFSKELVLLSEEIQYLKSYIKIQNERFDGKISLQCNLADETLNYYIPKLILQPLAENSFEHGLVDKSGEWIITVQSIVSQDGDLLLCVKDNGIGMSPERLLQIQETLQKSTENAMRLSSHIGLSNVHTRIRLRCIQEKYGVTIHSTPQKGTSVCVCLKAFTNPEGEEHV